MLGVQRVLVLQGGVGSRGWWGPGGGLMGMGGGVQGC